MIFFVYFPSKHQKVKKCEKNVKTNSGVVSPQRMQKNPKILFKKIPFSDIKNAPTPAQNWRGLLFSFHLPNKPQRTS